MVKRLRASDKNFLEDLELLLNSRLSHQLSKDNDVSKIIQEVKKNGDHAIKFYNKKFDDFDSELSNTKVPKEEILLSKELIDPNLIDSLKLAKERIISFHQKDMPKNSLYIDKIGMNLGVKWSSINSVGVYVPGGNASYPSSVLMNVLPAKVAGVKRIVMAVPAPNGKINPLVLFAADLVGIEEIYRVGGAQAIAALAYGTKEIPKVEKIVGPGNAYVASAKRNVYGHVGIDTVAGPSEVLIVSDSISNPSWIAADILAQAEHDIDAQSILICDSEDFADKVESYVYKHLKKINNSFIANKSWINNGIIIINNNDNDDTSDLIKTIDLIAPEHLELSISNPLELINDISNAGAIFIGRYTPEAIGDYLAGPSHVLPTSRSARFDSGLSVFSFLKRSSLIECNEKAFNQIGGSVISLAEAEGLNAHALSVSLRLNEKN
ncbi:histidinol dehydrogenase [Alphaproteobacteria bacterium]|nr:histidinol dehydrogenase [Alphaproteobacteria bacterium]